MDDKGYEWHGHKKEMNEIDNPPNREMICRWKMGNGKNYEMKDDK